MLGAKANQPEVIRALVAGADPKLKARFTDIGAEPISMTPAEFEKFIADETEKWGKVVKFAGIRAD